MNQNRASEYAELSLQEKMQQPMPIVKLAQNAFI